jgi:hypothetical protein
LVNDKEVYRYWEARYGVIVANHHKDQNLFATVHSVFSFGYNGVQRKGVDCAIQHLASLIVMGATSKLPPKENFILAK